MSKPSHQGRTTRPSAGSAAVSEIVKRSRAVDVAKRLEVSESLVRAVATGQRRPGPALRTKLSETYDLDPALWDASAAPSKLAAATGRAPSSPPRVVGTSLAECESNIARLRKIAEDAANDPACSHRDKATAGSALSAALRHLARLRGEGDITKSQIVRSQHWSAIVETIASALLPFPEAAGVVVKALRELDGTA